MSVRCPSCGASTPQPARFCGHCGLRLADADGLAPAEPVSRQHWSESPCRWVAGCCDRGLVHAANEDAVAVAGDDRPGGRAVLVVCDGVTAAADAEVAALAAARAARDVLVGATRPGGEATQRAAGWVEQLGLAVARAAELVLAAGDGGPDGPACTLAAAVLDGDLVVYGLVGDSRVYWLPDVGAGEPVQLGVDDSVAQFRIELGVDRERAEHSPHAHALTRWLGPDSPDMAPHTGSVQLTAPGWLLACSDGLWNSASEADALQRVVGGLGGAAAEPAGLARGLVGWANEQGGRDNIAVALARVGSVVGVGVGP